MERDMKIHSHGPLTSKSVHFLSCSPNANVPKKMNANANFIQLTRDERVSHVHD